MKTLLLLSLSASSLIASPITDRISSTELNARRASASPITAIGTTAPARETQARPSDQSLIKQSTIISDGVNWTIVPKGAVLHAPEDFAGRLDGRPVGNLLSWQDFSARNRAWISGEEISLRQAEGVEAIDARRTAYWPKQSKIIVAVHLGGPISVSVAEEAHVTAQN